MDLVDVTVGAYRYVVLVVVDASTNFICFEPQRDSSTELTKVAFRKIMDDMSCRPKAICADEYFTGDVLYPWFEQQGIRIIRLGPMTPWPNKEAAVKLQKHHMNILADSVKRLGSVNRAYQKISVRMLVKDA